MKSLFKDMKSKLSSKNGMTLVEVLVAFSILMLIIVTFTPLFANYYRNIYHAGETTKTTYKKASLIERLFSNQYHNPNAYETYQTNVPLSLVLKSSTGSPLNTITFGSEDEDAAAIRGTLVTTDGATVTTDEEDPEHKEIKERRGNASEYTTFYIKSADTKMMCFPSSLTDDFIEKSITVVPIGFQFGKEGHEAEAEAEFDVKYTNQNGQRVSLNALEKSYYDVEVIWDGNETEEKESLAILTFKGANDVICFQNSPLEICYNGHSVLVEITAPEIIMVGEAVTNAPNPEKPYYYFATAGVDVKTGRLDLIAKQMKSKTDNAVDLNAAMNDVEWVKKGMGSDENGRVNKYGYYVMGGDNGQVRRFWRNETTGNYYWGGDYLVQFQNYFDADTGAKSEPETESFTALNKGKSTHQKTFKKTLTTQASYEVFYGADNWPQHAFQLGDYETYVIFVGTGKFALYQGSYGTVTAKNGVNGITPNFYYGGTERYNRDAKIIGNDSHYRDTAKKKTFGSAEDAALSSYRAFTGDETAMPITITSVGAVSLNSSSNDGYLTSVPYIGAFYKYNNQTIQYKSTIDSVEAYPQSSYTLYCGTIPAYLSLYGYYFANKPTEQLTYVATPGIGYDKDTNTYGITGIFADKNTDPITLNGKTYAAKDLCRYIEQGYGTGDIGKGSTKPIIEGALISDYYQDVSITGKKVVDVTIGYLSQPYANSNAPLATHFGENSDNYLDSKGGDSNFYNAASREFSTFLDIATYYDDYREASFSVAVGYGLGIFGRDARGYNRLCQVYNIGTIYLRASGDGTSTASAVKHSAEGEQTVTDTADSQLYSGRGWSLKLESNVFHPFYGIDQYALGNYVKLDGTTVSNGRPWDYNKYQTSCKGWNDDYHHQWMTYVPPGSTFSSGGNKGSEEGDEPSHVLSQTKCTTVAVGANPNEFVEFMVGTENGTVLSWYNTYNDSDQFNEPSHAMKKEFENYTWSERNYLFGLVNKYQPYVAPGGSYDYWSTLDNGGTKASEYSFISSLTEIKDIQYGDGYWVVAGTQGTRVPKDTGSGNKAYTNGGASGSYVNVRYFEQSGSTSRLAWKAVQFTSENNVDIVSVEYCQGIWYLVGSTASGEGVIYYAKDPSVACETDPDIHDSNDDVYYTDSTFTGWRKCLTRKSDDTYGIDHTYAIDFTGGSATQLYLTGVNSAACQG